MKTPPQPISRRPARPPRARRKPDCQEALRACEAAAARIKSAGDELAACWTALCRDISAGVPPTDLLRKRAWCNVLELRLKEQAHALEDARLAIDKVWGDMMQRAHAREVLSRFIRKSPVETLPTAESLPLLLRAAEVLAAARRPPASMKK
jgi:hypothetical protein